MSTSTDLQTPRLAALLPAREDWARYLVLVPLLLAALLAPMNRPRPFQHVTYADIALILALLAVFLRQFGPRRTIHLPLAFLLPPVVVLLGGLLQQFFLDGTDSLPFVFHYFVAAAIVPMLIFWTVAGDRRAQLAVAAAWVCGTAFSSLVGIFAHHGIQLFGFYDPYANWYWGGYRISGLSFHPNLLAICSAMAMAFLVVAGILVQQRALRAAIAALIVLLFYALDLTGSRAALAAVLLILPLLLWTGLGQIDLRRRLTVFAVAGAVLVLAFAALNLSGQYDSASAFDRLFGGSNTEISDRTRAAIRQQVFRDFFEHPIFGAGYVHIRDAHNFFLQFLQSGGLVGLSGFLGYVGMLVVMGARCWIDRPGALDRLMTAGTMGGVAVWLLIGLYQNAVVERAVYVPIGLLLAMAYGHRRTDSR